MKIETKFDVGDEVGTVHGLGTIVVINISYRTKLAIDYVVIFPDKTRLAFAQHELKKKGEENAT